MRIAILAILAIARETPPARHRRVD